MAKQAKAVNSATKIKTETKVAEKAKIETVNMQGAEIVPVDASNPVVNKVDGEAFRYNPNMTDQQADAAIQKLRTSGLALKKLAHETACNIAMHYERHGDFRKMNDLLDAISEGMGNAYGRDFRTWVLKFTSLKWQDQEPAGYDRKKYGRFKPHFKHLKSDRRINKKAGNNGYFNQQGCDNPFYKGGLVERPAPAALDAEAVNAIVVNAIKRLVRLEVERLVGRGADKVKLAHEVNSELVADLIKLSEKHHIKIDDATKMLDENRITLN